MKKWLFFMLEAVNLLFLIKGPPSLSVWSAFVTSHAIVVALLFSILRKLVNTDGYLRSRIGPNFMIASFPLAAIPVFGPVCILALIVLLKGLKTRYRELALYEMVPLERMETSSGIFSGLTGVPDKDLMEFIHGKAQEAAFRWGHYVKTLTWTPFKVKFLRFLLEYAKEAHIILDISRQMEQQRANLLGRIRLAEGRKDLFAAAKLYHEVYSLSLLDPISNYHYFEIACRYMEETSKKKPEEISTLITLAEWLIGAGMLEKAENYLIRAQKTNTDKELDEKIVNLLDKINLYRENTLQASQ